MNITIINGMPDSGYTRVYEEINEYKKSRESDNIDIFNIKDMDINYCCGCFKCWVKNPGKCIFKDDMSKILFSITKADYLIYVSPIVAGFLSANTKKVMDRTIPYITPFIKIYNNECHHVPRYDNDIVMGLILIDDGQLDDKAVDISYSIIDRLKLNLHASSTFKSIAQPSKLQEVLNNEISSN